MDEDYSPSSRQENSRDFTISSSVGPTRQKKSSNSSSPYTRNQSSSTYSSSSSRNHASTSKSYEESRASTPLSDYEVLEPEPALVKESTFLLLQPTLLPPKKAKVSHARKTPPGHIKRPPNAFILFRSHCCTPLDSPSAVNFSAPGTPSAQQLSELGITDHRHISRITSHLWKSLTSVERGFWERQALVKKEEHKALFPDYKYKPIYRNKDEVRRRRKGEPGEMEEEKKGCEEVARALLNGPRARIVEEEEEGDQMDTTKDSRSTRFALPSTNPSTKKSSSTSNKKSPSKASPKGSRTGKKSTNSTFTRTAAVKNTNTTVAAILPPAFIFPQVNQTHYESPPPPEEPISSSSSLDQFYKQQQQKSRQLQTQHHQELHRQLITPQVVRSTQYGYFDQPHTNAQQQEHQRQQQQRQQQQQQEQAYYNQSTQYATQRNQNDYTFPTGVTPLPSTPTSQSLDEATRSFYAHRNSDAPVGLKKRGQLGVIAKDGEGNGGDLMLISSETGARKFSIGQWAAGDTTTTTGSETALASPLVAFEFDPDFLQSVMRGAQLAEKSEGIEYEYVDDADQEDRNRQVGGGERRMTFSWSAAPLNSKDTPNKEEGYHVMNQDYFSRPTTDPFQTPKFFDFAPSSQLQNQQLVAPSINSPSFGGSFRPDSPGMFSRYSNNSISNFDQQHQQQPFTPNEGRFSMTWSGRSRNNSEATLRVGDGLGRRESLEEAMRRLEREAAVAVLKQSQDQMPPSSIEGVHQGYIFLSREQAMDQLLVDQILLAGFGVTHEPFDA